MFKKILFIPLLAIILYSCGSKKYQAPLTAQVNVISEDPNKTIELRSIGFGKNEQDAYYDAETKAFEILFFRGIPNTSIEKPLVGIEDSDVVKKNETYFKSFFKNRYKSFIMSSYQASPAIKNKGVTSLAVDIKINLISLKNDLESQGIIRKFGF